VCTGSDLTAALFGQVVAPADRIVLVGGTAEQARTIAERYGLTNLRHHQPPMGFIRDAAATEACLRFVEQAAPFRFCFLAVGSPQQELLAQRLRTRGAATGLALCVGAALNFITGAERRAPRWMQQTALEWLYRLSNDPARMARRYLIRGPRIFALLLANRLALRSRRADAAHLPRASGGASNSAP
jgi:N-acetylglucosaminyldiphosphoundecaprenol N-acetyl-beta-D-mannosaminyltransferase